jgi:putative ABC transport system permease protein
MSFIPLMLKNPFKNRTNAVLTIVGTAVRIATIVALVMITMGLQNATTNTPHAGAPRNYYGSQGLYGGTAL